MSPYASDIKSTKSQNLIASRLILQLFLCNISKPGVKSNEDVVGAAPTGDALVVNNCIFLLRRLLY